MMGRVYSQFEGDKLDLERALTYFFKSLKCFGKIDHPRGQAITLKDLHDLNDRLDLAQMRGDKKYKRTLREKMQRMLLNKMIVQIFDCHKAH
jgi:hypothetical protein